MCPQHDRGPRVVGEHKGGAIPEQTIVAKIEALLYVEERDI